MQEMKRIFGRVIGPILIHFLVLNIVQMTGLHVDAAFLVGLAALIVLPVFLRFLQRDGYFRRPRHSLPVTAYIGIPLLALACNVLMTLLMTELSASTGITSTAQEQLFGSGLVTQLIGVGILAPVMEEVLFRGLVYNRLRDYNNGWLSVVLAAGLFAVYHGNIMQICFAFPMGLIIIAIYRKYETLAAPVLFHITVNLSSILASAIGIG